MRAAQWPAASTARATDIYHLSMIGRSRFNRSERSPHKRRTILLIWAANVLATQPLS
jgi:hypothetical protein